MTENKIRKLLTSARKETAPAPAPGFEARVMAAVRQAPRPEAVSVFGQLNDLFPRLAVAAAVLIGLCVAADLCASALEPPDLAAGVAQLSEQWLFATKAF